ncbi:glycosyltransferase family 61 protein [Flavobacterium sp.]|uniref:glycosyltransferase family 61 protein n=1 Tax=Flavobacterium sp. TaxID=239 RepID=UPI00286C619C|nr:glycosyltransferase family 61 protein [Flavobacterium sp.]
MNSIQYPEQVCHRKLPINFKQEDLCLFEGDLKHTNKEKSMLFLKNIDYLKDTLFDKRHFKFYDDYCFVLKKPLINLLARLIYYSHKSQTIDQAVWVTDNWSKEYFHWFADVISRILIAEEYIKGHVIVLPHAHKKYKYISESLDLLGVSYTFLEKKNVHFNNLILTPKIGITGNYDKVLINQVRDRFIDSDKQPSKYIYISRQKANRRKVTNEEEVIAVLLKHHFEIHFFEDYTLAQQIQIMQDTKILMSIHGAGLTNMLFMPKNAKIVELRNETESRLNCFFSLASDLNHEYYYLTNTGTSTTTHTADITVDVNKLETELQKILN